MVVAVPLLLLVAGLASCAVGRTSPWLIRPLRLSRGRLAQSRWARPSTSGDIVGPSVPSGVQIMRPISAVRMGPQRALGGLQATPLGSWPAGQSYHGTVPTKPSRVKNYPPNT